MNTLHIPRKFSRKLLVQLMMSSCTVLALQPCFAVNNLAVNSNEIIDNPSTSGNTQLNSTQLNSTQLNSTQLNSTQLNSTQLNSTQLNSTQDSNPKNDTVLATIKVKAKKASDPLSLNKQTTNGALGSHSQLDTPFSTTVVTQKQLEDHQVSTIGQVFSQDAAVVASGNTYTSRSNYLTVRGLLLDRYNNYKINGIPIFNFGVELPYESFEQIELLKGLSGFMYGFGSPGGIVNYVTKKPTDQSTQSIDVGYKSDSIWSEHLDLGGRFGSDDIFGYRINATHEQGNTYIKDGSIDRNALSLDLDAHLTPNLLWTFDAIYQNRQAKGSSDNLDFSSYPDTTLPKPISGTTNLTSMADGINNSKFQLYMTGLQYNLTPDWKLSTNFGYTDTKMRYTEDWPKITASNGDYEDWFYGQQEKNLGFRHWQGLLEGHVSTGTIQHQIVLGTQWQQEFYISNNTPETQIGTSNLYQPSIIEYVNLITPNMYKLSTVDQTAVFASDTLKFSDQWSALAGLRETDYKQIGYTPTGTVSSTYKKDNVLTPTLALMYQPLQNTTIYGSYVESLEQGSTVGIQYKNANELLPPMKSKQYELGVKSEQSNLSTTAALFRIERAADYANADNYYVQNGTVRYQGLELNAALKTDFDWAVGTGLVLLDPKYVKTGTSMDGNTVAAASKYVATLQASYNVPQVLGLSFEVDGKYVGASELDSANTIKIPSYFTPNLGASYATHLSGHPVTFRARIENLTGKNYWYTQSEDSLLVGPPRTASLNVNFDF